MIQIINNTDERVVEFTQPLNVSLQSVEMYYLSVTTTNEFYTFDLMKTRVKDLLQN